jgi:Rod binding domain-containing protein
MTTQQVLHRTEVAALTARVGLARAQPVDPGTAKLVSAAREFEAMMLDELLKPLHFGTGVGATGEDGAADEAADGAAATIEGMSTEALAQSMAAHGGFGIASRIVGEVEAERAASIKKKGGTKVV